ncbi:polysaccharide deacetylase family protein [Aurantiacibacter suaedae]|uniref:polysaccharide deacetylase family protein n=1 Tax=Aurantiacibacter suaedae TaxID=2545755 RepID=UPI0010F7F838|nr:polysaccharide deacetylase family protein [Aurantiacibacter suaedae]
MAVRSLLDPPPPQALARFPDGKTRYLVTVDTEEEFDWDKPIKRDGYGLEHVSRLAQFQQFCEEMGVVPIYLVDWPIATSALAGEILRDPVAAGRAEVGVQLHPWVNPPFSEEVSQTNSFAGNLPFALEAEKFARLRDRIEAQFGAAPLIYRAGRYGLGPRTAEILQTNGIAIDTSVRAKFDYAASGGPDYRLHPLAPYWLDDAHTMLELPLTTTFWGLLRELGDAIYPRLWRMPQARGALSRLGLLERIPLTPEGVGVDEAIRGIDMALDAGLPVLMFSFHSPSLAPGHTPYVRSAEDLARLYDWWRRIFAYCEGRGVVSSSAADVLASVAR